MDYQILNVSANNLDGQSLTITLNLKPSFLDRWLRKVPAGKNTFRGYGKRWYDEENFQPAPQIVSTILFSISYDPCYRHLQKQAEKKNK